MVGWSSRDKQLNTSKELMEVCVLECRIVSLCDGLCAWVVYMYFGRKCEIDKAVMT